MAGQNIGVFFPIYYEIYKLKTNLTGNVMEYVRILMSQLVEPKQNKWQLETK